MSARVVVVSGTGTGIGKTHFCEALLLSLGRDGVPSSGVKPVETGFDDSMASDAARLERSSSFHVKHPGERFADPVSPHIAAREAKTPLSLPALAHDVADAAQAVEVLVVELAGGLFSPLSESTTNADLAALIQPDLHVLVAADRLGVLHDLIATTRAAAGRVTIDGIVLTATERPDTSYGRNAPEIPRLLSVPLFGVLARAGTTELASTPTIRSVIDRLLRPA